MVGGNSVICGDFNYWVDDPSSKPFSAEFIELLDLNNFENFVCSDRILTCRIKSIRSPAKVGLVVTDLITSPVASWEGWETPPPSTEAQLSFFAQPPAGEDLSLLW